MQIIPKPKHVMSSPNIFDTSGNNLTTKNTVRNAAHVTHPEAIPEINRIVKLGHF